ncbi:MAG: sulfotransferase family protein [Litorimonas sp.]
MDEPSSSQGIAILGMHRSGTSMMAGTLRAAGLYFGDVYDAVSTRNARGLHEPLSILFMHEDILVKNRGSWHEPPKMPEWKPLHRAVRDLFIESRQSHKRWAFKDPRTLLVIDGWLDALPNLDMVGIFRHPAEVAFSIRDRNNFELEKNFKAWCVYNAKLLELVRERKIPLIEFVRDKVKMRESFERLFAKLDIEMTPEANAFFEPDLRRFETPDIPLSEDALQIYSDLKDHIL